jgi:hypothetical protein
MPATPCYFAQGCFDIFVGAEAALAGATRLSSHIFCFSENNYLPISPNQKYIFGHPVPLRGAFRERHKRGAGMRWTQQRRA